MEEHGEKQKRYWPWVVFLAIPGAALIIFGTLWEFLPIFQEGKGVYVHSREVDRCIEAGEGGSGTADCIFEVSSEIYKEDPEAALEFCILYAKDPQLETLLRIQCQREITKRLEE